MDGADAEFWGHSSRRRWLAVVAIAVAVAAWPVVGGASSGTPASRPAPQPDAASREEAIAVAAPHSTAVAQATDRVTQAHAAVDQIEQDLGALRITAYQENTKVLPLAAADSLAQTRTQRYGNSAAQTLTANLVDAQHELGAAEQQQEQALADYFAALAALAAAQEADRVAHEQSAPSTAGAVSAVNASEASAPPTGTCADDLACFLACTRAHESDTAGGYAAVSPDGTYHGAYQFDQTTWDSVAGSIGRGDLVGVDPASATPADQDTLATALYEMRGNQPWGGRC